MNISTEIISSENALIAKLKESKQKEIDSLKSKIDSLNNKSVTPTSDALNKSFHLGQVGYMSGSGAKRKARELEKEIAKSKELISLESELKHIEAQMSALNKGKIIRPNGLSVPSYESLVKELELVEKALKEKTLRGKPLTQDQTEILKDIRSSNKKKIKEREKNHLKNL